MYSTDHKIGDIRKEEVTGNSYTNDQLSDRVNNINSNFEHQALSSDVV
jgi:hypothetical protein